MRSHLLSLSALHAAAPGVLDVVFGPDGDFEGAPRWKPPLWDGAWAHHFGAVPDPIDDLALDLRVPSVVARLAGLCARAAEAHEPWTQYDEAYALQMVVSRASVERGAWTDAHAARLAALTLTLAPRIAALKAAS